MPINVFNIYDFGAAGDGFTDDTVAISQALTRAIDKDGVLEIPPGKFLWKFPSNWALGEKQLSIKGYGPNVSRLLFGVAGGPSFNLAQYGIHQPYGINIQDIGLYPTVPAAGTALKISHGNPTSSNEHFTTPVILRNVIAASNDDTWWSDGIDLTACWEPTLTDVIVSGNAARGVWNNMGGVGIRLNRMCVNATLTNVKMNFWGVGLQAHADQGFNTEGTFCSNCSMVAVKRGVWLKGNPNVGAGRISTLTWMGGLIENRVGGVTGGSAAFHLENIYTALINGVQCITETIDKNVEYTYGFCLQDCGGVIINACDINAYTHGVLTTGASHAISVANNTFTNTAAQVVFNEGTYDSRSYGNVRFNGDISEVDHDGRNKIGFYS